MVGSAVIASQRVPASGRPEMNRLRESNPGQRCAALDCFVASLLAMTMKFLISSSPIRGSRRDRAGFGLPLRPGEPGQIRQARHEGRPEDLSARPAMPPAPPGIFFLQRLQTVRATACRRRQKPIAWARCRPIGPRFCRSPWPSSCRPCFRCIFRSLLTSSTLQPGAGGDPLLCGWALRMSGFLALLGASSNRSPRPLTLEDLVVEPGIWRSGFSFSRMPGHHAHQPADAAPYWSSAATGSRHVRLRSN